MIYSFGSVLREERERLGLNQTAFAEACGVKQLAQSNYENDKRKPDASYLLAAARLGVDMNYLFTGVRSPDHYLVEPTLTHREFALLDNYQHLTEADKASLERHALVLAQQTLKKGKTA